MQRKSEIELARTERAEIIRSLTRLKYRLIANREINNLLPDSLLEFDKALQSGELLEINLSEALDVTSKTS
jgi:hypothetical protein